MRKEPNNELGGEENRPEFSQASSRGESDTFLIAEQRFNKRQFMIGHEAA